MLVAPPSMTNTLIQLGTEHDVSSRGATQYYAWVEVLPNYPILNFAELPKLRILLLRLCG